MKSNTFFEIVGTEHRTTPPPPRYHDDLEMNIEVIKVTAPVRKLKETVEIIYEQEVDSHYDL